MEIYKKRKETIERIKETGLRNNVLNPVCLHSETAISDSLFILFHLCISNQPEIRLIEFRSFSSHFIL